MMQPMILASGSDIRARLLTNARIPFEVIKPRVDEDMVRQGLAAEGIRPRDMADALAELKAAKVAAAHSTRRVLASDQILEFQGEALGKPETKGEALTVMQRLSGQSHKLHSAAVIYEEAHPVWRAVETVEITLSDASESYLADYLDRNWESVRHSVGGYKLEEEGVQLMTAIRGCHFVVLGLPLVQILGYLRNKGEICR